MVQTLNIPDTYYNAQDTAAWAPKPFTLTGGPLALEE